MEYKKFELKAKEKITRVGLHTEIKSEQKEYPKFFEIKKTPNFKKELIVSKEENREEQKTATPSKILCGILAIILMFTGIYLSEIKAPNYIEAVFRTLTSKISEKAESDTKKIQSKTIGEKYFVEAKTDNKNEIIIEIPTENSSFAEKIKNQAVKTEVKAEEIPVISEWENIEKGKIKAKNMSPGSDKIYCTNRTDLEINPDKYLSEQYPIEKITVGTENPKVLILHTHGTESYTGSGDDGTTRTTDTERNIVRIGKEMSEILNLYGIPTIHSKTMHDEISYVKSYENSKKEAMLYLEKYPSIEYVIDIHRDALGTSEEPVKTYTEINGEPSAQLMFVVGTNASGGNHPDYEKNLTTAVHIQDTVNKIFPGLMRPINIRPVIFNQNLAHGYLLLEVGSDANTIDEALCSVRMFARSFAQVVLQGKPEV